MSGIFVQRRLVHYESLGRGSPILFLHGWLGSWRYWVPVMDELSGEHRTYALDLWGFGDSDGRVPHGEIDAYVDLVVDFMDQLGVWRTPLVGHTLGAAVAARMAVRHPDRVVKVMAIGLPLTAEAINRKLLAPGSNEALARLFWHRQKPYPEVDLAASKTADNVLTQTILAVARMNLHDMVEEVDVPMLTVYGEKDPVIDGALAHDVETDHSVARAIILPGTHHFPMLDQPATFTRLLRDFMDVEDQEDLLQLTIKKEWRRRTR